MRGGGGAIKVYCERCGSGELVICIYFELSLVSCDIYLCFDWPL